MYDITAVPPLTPVIRPLLPTVIIDGLPLLHVPPPTVSDRPVVVPWQKLLTLLIVPVAGAGLALIVAAAVAVPQLLVTV